MENRLEEVRTLLLSLLIARKGATPIPVLERDYYEIENKRIPCRQFGYENVVQFLQSMPEHFVVEEYNGNWCVRGIASNKSKHVSSLVSRQKTTFNNPRIRCSRQSFVNRYVQHTKPQQVRIAYDKLYLFMQYVKNNPNGVSLQNAMLFVQQLVPNVNISPYDFQTQLYELSHQLRLDGNMIYPILNDSQSNATQQPSNQPLTEEPMQLWNESKFLNDSASPPTQQTIYLAGQEEFEWITCHEESDEDDLLVSRNDTHNGRRVKTSEVLATNLAQYVKSEQTDTVNYNEIDMEINEENLTMMSNNNIEIKAEISQDKSEIVSDRIKSRLVKLLQKYPNGIWCAELPDIYLQEYKVHLNYDKLGFTSVREFTSYLPKIFYMTQLYKDDDFKLYSADKRPVVPKTESVDIIQDSHNQYDKHRTAQVQCSNNYDDAPIPSDVSPNITKRFAPNDVMNYGDDVNKILVTDLQCTKKFLEVYIMEVFNPSFFWIHLRENRRPFDRMMDELFNFYELNKDIYTIAKVALRKDLNCACIYSGRWHRGIIRSVKPDFRVTVFFYDYGTMKTYAPEDIYYLHKQFSVFPAQAIPCGLYNVKPCVGDRWKRTVHDRFIDRVAETLLAATIISIDTLNNSMMVILTDTTEEEDVCINDWLVKEKLAHVGKMVRIKDIMEYCDLHSTSVEIFNTESAVNVNELQHCKNQSCDETIHRLSDVKSEDIQKRTVKSLHNIPTNKKQLLQKLRSKSPDVKSPDTISSDVNSLDAKSQSSNLHLQNRKLKAPKEFIPLLEKLEGLRFNGISDSNSNNSISETNTDNKNNTKQIDSNEKIKLQNSEDCYGFMNFSLRNSDDEDDQNDFGTFRSLYGGRGLMEPIDWSVIKENNLSLKTAATISNNLDVSIKKCKNDVKDKSEAYNQRNELPGKKYFLNLTSLEKENFLPENNIDYDENMSDFIETLKNKKKSNHIVTVMFTPNTKLKSLHDSQSEDTSNSTNTVNNAASLKEMEKVDRNDEVCSDKTRADQKIENRDSKNFTDSKSVFSNMSNNKDNLNREMSECDTNNSLQSNTNSKSYNPRYKMLLDKLKRKQMDSMDSSFVNTSRSSSSEQIPLSSYSCNTSNDTIISSSDEQFKLSNVDTMDTNAYTIDKEPASTSELSKKLTLDELCSDFERTRNLSFLEIDVASSNVDDKKHPLNQFLETDFIVSSNDDTKQNQFCDSIAPSCNVDLNYQLTVANQTDIPKLMQWMLKIVQNEENNSELDSDDLSQESVKDNKSDESKGDDKSDCMFEMHKSMNNDANINEIAFTLNYNDCDVESDESEWDAGCAGTDEDFPFYIAQKLKQEMSITEI